MSTKAKEMYTRAIQGYKEVEGDHDADIKYLEERISLLSTNNNAPSSIRGVHQQRSSGSPEHLTASGANSSTRRSEANKMLPKRSMRDRVLS